MNSEISFKPYEEADKDICLGLFDANCPEFFAPNERADYSAFLDQISSDYELCLIGDAIAGAFGLMGNAGVRRSLNWILLDPRFHGRGVGRAIMERVVARASVERIQVVGVAASHKSAPFFARFGAVALKVTENGWGPGMHRIDMELRPGTSKP